MGTDSRARVNALMAAVDASFGLASPFGERADALARGCVDARAHDWTGSKGDPRSLTTEYF
jgi:hypothetical protein